MVCSCDEVAGAGAGDLVDSENDPTVPKPVDPPAGAAAEPEVNADVVAEEAVVLKPGKDKAEPVKLELVIDAALAEVAAGVEALAVVVAVGNRDEEVVPKPEGLEAGVAEKEGAEAGD